MSLTTDEKKLLKQLVQKEKEEFEKEGKTMVVEDTPEFLAIEEKYEMFLDGIISKL